MRFYFFWSSPQAAAARLLLGYKQLPAEMIPLTEEDDETFFSLGIARSPFVLQCDDGRLVTDLWELFDRCDERWPGRPLWEAVDPPGWQALLAWRTRAAPLLARLHAAAGAAYRDIGATQESLEAYKRLVVQRFGMSLEELANDRYAGFGQLDSLTGFRALGRHLAERRFYFGKLSVADLVITADLHPLEVLDGLSLGVDLMYYLERTQEACGVSLRDGWLVA